MFGVCRDRGKFVKRVFCKRVLCVEVADLVHHVIEIVIVVKIIIPGEHRCGTMAAFAPRQGLFPVLVKTEQIDPENDHGSGNEKYPAQIFH